MHHSLGDVDVMTTEVCLSHPSELPAAYAEEVDLLFHTIELWWANHAIHKQLDHIDLNATHARLRRRAATSSSLFDYAIAVREELWTLGDGHLRLQQTHRQFEKRFTSGLSFNEVIEGLALAWVEHSDSATTHLLERGDLLIEIDGVPVESYLQSVRLQPGSTADQRRWNAIRSLSYQERFPNEPPQPKQFLMEKPGGRRLSIDVSWVPAPNNTATPNCVRGRLMEPRVGLLEINSFYCCDEFGQVSDKEFHGQAKRAADTLEDVDELIVDLRHNGGGRDQQAKIAASLLTPEALEWFRYKHMSPYDDGSMQTFEKSYVDNRKLSLPSISYRRLCFLVGPGCFSTAEIFASAFKHQADVIFVGDTTAGGAGNPIEFRLPYSGLAISIPVTQFSGPGSDTSLIEGSGITPDFKVVQTLADLLNGRDTVLDRALFSLRQP